MPDHTVIGVRCNVCFPGRDTNVWRVLCVSLHLWGDQYYLKVSSTSRRIVMPSVKLLCKYINTNGWWYLHHGKYNQQKWPGEFKNTIRTVFQMSVYNETRWTILNVHLSYKPPNYCRILFHSRGHPRQFSRLKKFRALVGPGGGYYKGIVLQGSQLKCRFFYGYTSRSW